MKLKHIFNILTLPFLLLAFSSCKKLVEVSPQTQIEDIEFFSNEQGFKEALNGVYLNMGRTSQYGRELTFGLTDVIGSMYVLNTSNGSQLYRDAFAGLYANREVSLMIDTIWGYQYNSIANTNKLISHLERVDSSMFKKWNYNVIKGEAFALRAFLHFDILRLFGTSYAAGGADIPAIPYVKNYSNAVTPKSTSSQVVGAILEDISKALEALKSDPIYTGEVISSDIDNGYLLNRNLHLNYYAVKALEARVQLWANNKPQALAAAEAVMSVATVKFPWVTQSSVSTSTESARNRIFLTEHLFGLYINDIAANYTNLLDTTRFQTTLTLNNARITQQFEAIGSADYRRVYLLRELTNIPTPKTFFGKLYQPNGMDATLAKKVPLIRIPEMYYIAAECLKETDGPKAVQHLNTVRASRGITQVISSSSTPEQIQDEIRKEYWKEFPLEGQMFYYYKRQNSTTVPAVNGTYPSARYVLPLPPAEIEFGL